MNLRKLKSIKPQYYPNIHEDMEEDERLSIGNFQLDKNKNNKKLIKYKNSLPTKYFLTQEERFKKTTNIYLYDRTYEYYEIEQNINVKLTEERLVIRKERRLDIIMFDEIIGDWKGIFDDGIFNFYDYEKIDKDDLIFIIKIRDSLIKGQQIKIGKLERVRTWLWAQIHKIGFRYDRNGGLMRS